LQKIASEPAAIAAAASRTTKTPAKESTWESTRNYPYTKANWQFTTKDARIKLNRIYLQFE